MPQSTDDWLIGPWNTHTTETKPSGKDVRADVALRDKGLAHRQASRAYYKASGLDGSRQEVDQQV